MNCTKYKHKKIKNNHMELLGMPAVGKTTYVKNIKKYDYIEATQTIPSQRFFRILYKVKIFTLLLIKKPHLVMKDLKIIVSSKQESIIDFFKVTSNWFLVAYQTEIQFKRKQKRVVYDQGIYQALWSILFSAKNQNLDIGRLLEYRNLPEFIIFLDASNTILRVRNKKRIKKIRLNYDNLEEIKKAKNIFDIIKDVLGEEYLMCDKVKS